MDQKAYEFVHYVPTVTERLKSITTQYLRRAMNFLGHFLNHYKILMFPHPLHPPFDVTNPKFGQCTNDGKRIEITIYRRFEENTLTAKYRFSEFWDFNPSLDVIIGKIGPKRSKFAYLVRKVKEWLKWSQNENKLMCQTQFVVERPKPDLHGLLERTFSWRWFF